jgi:hypothetical protein
LACAFFRSALYPWLPPQPEAPQASTRRTRAKQAKKASKRAPLGSFFKQAERAEAALFLFGLRREFHQMQDRQNAAAREWKRSFALFHISMDYLKDMLPSLRRSQKRK